MIGGLLFRGVSTQLPRSSHVRMELDSVQIEPVRPSQNSIIEENPGKVSWIAEWLDHLTAFSDERAEIVLAFSSIREADKESMPSAQLDIDHIDNLVRKPHLAHSTSAPRMRSSGLRA